MKSDREFLQGIYKKSDEMKQSKQFELDKAGFYEKTIKSIFKKSSNFRIAMVMGVFLLVITSGFMIRKQSVPKESVTPNSVSVIPRVIPNVTKEELLFHKVTDVIEIQSSLDSQRFEILNVYTGNTKEELLLDKINSSISSLNHAKSGIVLLQVSEKEITILDIYYSEDEKQYVNSTNHILTIEEINKRWIESN
ncbi:MAG: hypothetical protein ACK5JH_13425 [Anaerocolumna sp.]